MCCSRYFDTWSGLLSAMYPKLVTLLWTWVNDTPGVAKNAHGSDITNTSIHPSWKPKFWTFVSGLEVTLVHYYMTLTLNEESEVLRLLLVRFLLSRSPATISSSEKGEVPQSFVVFWIYHSLAPWRKNCSVVAPLVFLFYIENLLDFAHYAQTFCVAVQNR